MRFLGIGEDGDLGDMYWRLGRAGHEVKMFVESPEAQGIYGGMVEHTSDWRSDLPWVRDAGDEGIVVFESAGYGHDQDRLRNEGFQVIGGSSFGDQLENDRSFGQKQLEGHGLRLAESVDFTDFGVALDFVREYPQRYVLKSNGANVMRTRNYVGAMDSGADIIALLSTYKARWRGPGKPDFVLMAHVTGVEVGVGAYFNGRRFLEPACLDWEHKHFFPEELGELTGEMGTIVTYRGAEQIFARTLAHMAEPLRRSGYCGYINLNLMANEQGLWPIEFTSRFGYPGFAICEALHEETWDRIFIKLLKGDDSAIATRPGYAAGVVLTVPPFPYRYGYETLSKGLPISFRETMTEVDHNSLHLAEVATEDARLVTSGATGYVGVANGIGDSVEQARERAYALAHKVVVPNLRYRTDIGQRVVDHDLAALRVLGYILS